MEEVSSVQEVEEYYSWQDDGSTLDADQLANERRIRHLLEPHLHGFNETIVRNLKNAYSLTKIAEYKKVYEVWREDKLRILCEMLEGCFPNRWEVKKINASDNHLESLLLSTEGNVSKMRSSREHTAYIYFPEILISNDSGNTWTIRDFYVIMEFDARLAMIGIRGFRATKTRVEYALSYTHSHMSCSKDDYGDFCFGSTGLDTLVVELALEPFDEVKLELLFQQLPDYLSWESLEGVPFRSIDRLITNGNAIGPAPSLPSNIYERTLREVIKAKIPLPTYLYSDSQKNLIVVIKDNIDLYRAITAFVPESYCFPMNELTLDSIYPASSISPEDISILNRRSNAKFLFKGNTVKLQITEDKEEQKNNIEKLVDKQIVTYVVRELEQLLRNYIFNKFWYGERTESNIHKV